MTRQDCLLIIFTRTPVAGEVKTRLIPKLGATGAMDLYLQLLKRTLVTVCSSDIKNIQLCVTSTNLPPIIQELQQEYSFSLTVQKGNNLGMRMHNAIEEGLKESKSVILIGCDCPELSIEDLNMAYEKIRNNYDTVIGPCEDGGYYLIAMKQPCSSLFEEIEWGTNVVFQETINRAKQQKLDIYELPLRWDVDRWTDVQRLQELEETGIIRPCV